MKGWGGRWKRGAFRVPLYQSPTPPQESPDQTKQAEERCDLLEPLRVVGKFLSCDLVQHSELDKERGGAWYHKLKAVKS